MTVINKGEKWFEASGIPLTVLEMKHGDSAVAAHAHEFIELVFFAEGTSLHEYGGKRYTLTPGDVFVIHPGEPHAYVSGRSVRIYNCLFYPQAIQPDLEYLSKMDGFFDLVMVEPFFRAETGLRGTLHLDSPTRMRVTELLESIKREIEQKLSGYGAAARSMLIQLLVTVARFHTQSLPAATDSDDHSGKRTLIRECIRYIEEHYPEEIRLEKLADLTFLSPEYFSKVFKRLTSQTPIEFVNTVRLEKAKQLLSSSSLTVTDVAFRTGFHDSNYFARQFKRTTGQTPLEYRRRNAAESA